MNALTRPLVALLLACLPLLWGSAARAELVPNLYQQEQLVLDQGSQERERAIEQGLQTVLVRVSGNPRVPAILAQRNALSNPSLLVDAYRYESSDEMLQHDGQLQPASRLVLNFSRPGIERLLRSAGLPLWSANRPAVLVWLVRDSLEGGREMVSLHESSETSAGLQDAARERGLPLVAPLLDLEDRLSVGAERIWRLDAEAIREASARYQADAILVGRYSQTSTGLWLGAWSLYHRGKQQVFDLESQEENQLLARGIAAVAEQLAANYAIVLGGASGDQVVLELSEVNSFAAYVAALNYLEKLDVVRQLQLLSVDQNRLRLQLQMESDISALANALQLDRKLLPVSTGSVDPGAPVRGAAAPGSPQQPLRYRWPG